MQRKCIKKDLMMGTRFPKHVVENGNIDVYK
jgi:hypothetical protein